MDQKGLIYSFVSDGISVLAEHTSCRGNFSTIAVLCLKKLPSTDSKYTYSSGNYSFNFLVDSGYVFVVVADEGAGSSLPYLFLERVKEDFMKKYAGYVPFEDRSVIAYSLEKEFGPRLKEHMVYCMNHAEEMSRLGKVNAQIADVKVITMDNIEKASLTMEDAVLTPDPTVSKVNMIAFICMFSLGFATLFRDTVFVKALPWAHIFGTFGVFVIMAFALSWVAWYAGYL